MKKILRPITIPQEKEKSDKGDIIKCIRAWDEHDYAIGELSIATHGHVTDLDIHFQPQHLLVIDEDAIVKAGDVYLLRRTTGPEIKIATENMTEWMANHSPIIASYPWIQNTFGISQQHIQNVIDTDGKCLFSVNMIIDCPEFPFFGAKYPDARCIDGVLWDLDKVDSKLSLIDNGDHPICPFCNTAGAIEEAFENWLESQDEDISEEAKIAERKIITERAELFKSKYAIEPIYPTYDGNIVMNIVMNDKNGTETVPVDEPIINENDRLGIQCPNCSRVIQWVNSKKDVPDMIKCDTCYALEYGKYEFTKNECQLIQESKLPKPDPKEFVVFEHHPNDDNMPEWVAHIPSIKGMCETGYTKSEALYELMLSLEVKLAYDNGVELSEKRKHDKNE